MSDVKKNPNVKNPLPLHIHNVPKAPKDSPVNQRFTNLLDVTGVELALSHSFKRLVVAVVEAVDEKGEDDNDKGRTAEGRRASALSTPRRPSNDER